MAYKTAWCHVDWFKFCIQLKSLKVRHFGLVKDTGLENMHRGRLQWHELRTGFREKNILHWYKSY